MFFLLFASVFAESIVQTINNNPSSTWVAREYPPSVITLRKFRAMLGESIVSGDAPKYVPRNDLPENFDARTQWPGKLTPVVNQGRCGGCWAFAAAETAGDRFSIKGYSYGKLSVQDLISCDTTCKGCAGCTGAASSKWIADNGITTDQCLPYVSGGGSVPSCPSKCQNGSEIIRYKYTESQSYTVNDVQQELMSNGPVYFRFNVYTDFMYYYGGIYQHQSGSLEGGHAVLLCGWGVENGVPYWLLQNSWGADWGEYGYFRMIRGKDDCGCEKGFFGGKVPEK